MTTIGAAGGAPGGRVQPGGAAVLAGAELEILAVHALVNAAPGRT